MKEEIYQMENIFNLQKKQLLPPWVGETKRFAIYISKQLLSNFCFTLMKDTNDFVNFFQ